MELDPEWTPREGIREAPAFAPTSRPVTAGGQTFPTDLGKGRKILVIDDNAVVLKGFEFKLRSAGFEVFTSTEGSEAVKLARSVRPDLVLVDINFPPGSGMHWDGFTILAWLHRQEGLEKVPIIVISSSEAEKYKRKSIESGALDFFQKPVVFPELLGRIRQILESPDPKS